MYSKAQLHRQLAQMGIKRDDTVLIHTSMKAVGPVEGGADGVIDAFCDYLNDGLFLVPTHTWANVNAQSPVYDVRTTVPCIGALPRTAAFRQDGVRSLHATHSVWAHGKQAQRYISGEEHACTPCPPGGCWSRLADVGAKILLLGVGHESNTFIHAVDEYIDVPDRLDATSYEVTVIDREGRQHRHAMHPHMCRKYGSSSFSDIFGRFEPAFIHTGAQTSGRFGNAEVRIIDAKKCRDTLLTIYDRSGDPDCFIDTAVLPASFYR